MCKPDLWNCMSTLYHYNLRSHVTATRPKIGRSAPETVTSSHSLRLWPHGQPGVVTRGQGHRSLFPLGSVRQDRQGHHSLSVMRGSGKEGGNILSLSSGRRLSRLTTPPPPPPPPDPHPPTQPPSPHSPPPLLVDIPRRR